MICIPDGEGWLLVAQMAHSLSCGEMAAAWGNDLFAQPAPREAIVLATQLHDIGWLELDSNPRLHEEQRPLNFPEMTLEETISIWDQAVSHAGVLNPYSALLISMHATTVFNSRLKRGTDPAEQALQVQEQLDEHAARQAGLRARLAAHPEYGPAVEPERLSASYRVLRVCDLLSLIICARALPPEGEIDDVPVTGPDDRRVIRYAAQDDPTLALDPYPFASPELVVGVEARWLGTQTFRDLATYHNALAGASWMHLAYRFVPFV